MRVALVMLKLGVEAKEAKKKLKTAGENLRVALGEASDGRRAARTKRGTRNG
jgi:N-acetylmuramic acid 6-phosphate (MurNAc-6-P) etherase